MNIIFQYIAVQYKTVVNAARPQQKRFIVQVLNPQKRLTWGIYRTITVMYLECAVYCVVYILQPTSCITVL